MSNVIDNNADGNDDYDYDDDDDDEEEEDEDGDEDDFSLRQLLPEDYFGLSICHCNTQERCNAAQVARLLIKGSTAHQVLGVDVDRSIVEALPLYSNHGPPERPSGPIQSQGGKQEHHRIVAVTSPRLRGRGHRT